MTAPLPEPVPTFLPAGFVGWPDETLDGQGVWLGPGATGTQGPVSRTRDYILGPLPSSPDKLDGRPSVTVNISDAASFPSEWFAGLAGEPIQIAASDGYLRRSDGEISLVLVREDWVVEVITNGVSTDDALRIARSLPFV